MKKYQSKKNAKEEMYCQPYQGEVKKADAAGQRVGRSPVDVEKYLNANTKKSQKQEEQENLLTMALEIVKEVIQHKKSTSQPYSIVSEIN